ncbi:MAG: hypothetical protein E7466_04585 [Ruminococcaceae bacterium]|nr:hypothetical protein [Oscillospiraceae bacterium]
MGWIPMVVIAGVTFGLCFLVDRLFTKTFRGKKQHESGLAVRLNKKYGAFGLILFALGVAAIFAGINGSGWPIIVGGSVVLLLGVGLVVYYLTFGVYYDDEGFVLTTFGKRSTTYRYEQIQGQLLYNSYGNILIELHMEDGRTVGLQAGMKGVYPFMDKAFYKWCAQKGLEPGDCDFHDPDNSLWFPMMEGK